MAAWQSRPPVWTAVLNKFSKQSVIYAKSCLRKLRGEHVAACDCRPPAWTAVPLHFKLSVTYKVINTQKTSGGCEGRWLPASAGRQSGRRSIDILQQSVVYKVMHTRTLRGGRVVATSFLVPAASLDGAWSRLTSRRASSPAGGHSMVLLRPP